MREAIGGTYLFQIVVLFILLFTGFISLSINYSRAYRVSTEIANIIERNNGLTEEAKNLIADYLLDVGYRTKGSCDSKGDEGFTGYELDSNTSDYNNNKSVFCLKEVTLAGNEEYPDVAYYRIKVFFKLDLPILNNLFEFGIKGSTKPIYYPVR